ncbi:Transmembrane protein 43 [Phytophthora citrophthora]|uniref:Transmembrane protein 43 n=1 Tax=Phytophthora citrophthora TaxID=4793 RepID=A0AAD9GNA3_9STRA|nr:Transmembrane protein 43 [Phytophthora citrophthora]
MQKEVAIGSLLLLASVATTCVFESSLVRSVKSFEEGRSVVVSLSKPQISANTEDQLIHFSGLITVASEHDTDELQLRQSPFVLDSVFGIAVKGVRLHRHVEMLQWVETSHTSTNSNPEDEDRRFDDDRERIYMYDLRWKEDEIDSSAFNDISYRNPPAEAWMYKSMQIKAKNLVVGEFSLPDELVDQIQRRDPVHLDSANRRVMTTLLDRRQGNGWEAGSALANVTVEEDFFYLRNEMRESVLGDQRVYFEVTPNYPVTVCAKQKGSELVPFRSSTVDSLFLLEDGIVSADELFDKKTHTEVSKNRFFRLFAAVLGFMGFIVLRRPLIERYGSLVAGIQQHLLASSMSIALTFSVVGFHWILYRYIRHFDLVVARLLTIAVCRPLWALILWIGGWVPPLGLFIFFRSKLELKNQ